MPLPTAQPRRAASVDDLNVSTSTPPADIRYIYARWSSRPPPRRLPNRSPPRTNRWPHQLAKIERIVDTERLDAISELPRPTPDAAAERAPRASTFARGGHTLNDVTKSGRAVSASIFERGKVKAKEAPPNVAWEEDDRVVRTTSALGIGKRPSSPFGPRSPHATIAFGFTTRPLSFCKTRIIRTLAAAAAATTTTTTPPLLTGL